VADIDAVCVSNSVAGIVTGQESIRGQTMLRGLEVMGKPIFNVENACASGSSAYFLARNAIASGMWETVLVVGTEKMAHLDRTVTYRALESASDLTDRDGSSDHSSSVFMTIYAEKIKKYMKATGATREDFAWVVVKNHDHAALNPYAQYRNRVTIEEVLESPEIAWPLTRSMCSPIGDGAAAVLLSARQSDRGVLAAGCGFSSGDIEKDHGEHGHSVRRAAAIAYEQAGLGAEDVHLAEVHDAAAPAELEMYEALGFCAEGDGPRLVRERATMLGGPLPVNTSGGLVSRRAIHDEIGDYLAPFFRCARGADQLDRFRFKGREVAECAAVLVDGSKMSHDEIVERAAAARRGTTSGYGRLRPCVDRQRCEQEDNEGRLEATHQSP